MFSIHRDRPDPNDRELRATIVSRLRENLYTQDGHIKVSVHDGVVHLSGDVPSRLARDIAARDVQHVPGVTDVELGLDIAA